MSAEIRFHDHQTEQKVSKEGQEPCTLERVFENDLAGVIDTADGENFLLDQYRYGQPVSWTNSFQHIFAPPPLSDLGSPTTEWSMSFARQICRHMEI